MTVTSPLTHTGHEIAELLAENGRLSGRIDFLEADKRIQDKLIANKDSLMKEYFYAWKDGITQIERLREALNKIEKHCEAAGPKTIRTDNDVELALYLSLHEARAALSETEWPTSIREWADRQETK